MEIRSLVIPVINTAFRVGPRITVAARGRAEQFRAMPRRVGGFTEDVDAAGRPLVTVVHTPNGGGFASALA